VDLAAGFGALVLGHASPALLGALADQGPKLALALGDLYASDVKVRLLERLAALDPRPGARALLGQSGGDAVTAALKTARLATGRPGVVSFVGAYHGLGYGPLAALGLVPSWREAFADQLNAHVRFAPYPRDATSLDASLEAVRRALATGEIGAVLVEPVQGRGGVVVPPAGFLAELRALTHDEGALLVADEVWTGLGRGGALVTTFADGVLPDLVCLGKGLGGGLPISACIGPDDVMQAWVRERGHEVVHTATFHGAPLACAAALATLDAIEAGGLASRANELGARALAMTNGDVRLAIVTVDAVGIFNDDVQRIRSRVKALLGAEAPDFVLVTATHTHEAPDTLGQWGDLSPASSCMDTKPSRTILQG
jgi:4-aminobutyrate aminotransferase/(S)-3-amino-2-methylpropionate transaminase